jgi:inosine-uridine nucleoside N-ribohydrolase
MKTFVESSMRLLKPRIWLAAFVCLFICPLAFSSQNQPMKLILDTDIGDDIDDAWALGFVISHSGFQPLGITISHGNTPARARIACKLLHVCRRGEIPVFVGRKTNDKVFPQYSWAEDFVAKQPEKKSAADFIVQTVKRYPGEVTLLAVGPLQNIADALRKEPNLGRYVKRVVLMSGCVYGTSYSPGKPIREWNVYQATEDAQLVYGSNLPLTIVPLDSTTFVQLSDGERKRIAEHESPLAYALECLYRLWLSGPAVRMTLHDQLAVAEAASPGAFFGRRETLPLLVDGEGFTRIDRERGKPVTVCFEPKREAFMNYYLSGLTSQNPGRR